jgi:beta-glucosidase
MIKNALLYTIMIPACIFFMSCANKQKEAFKEVETKDHSAVVPVVQTAEWAVEWWMPRHDSINKRLKEGNVDLLFIGNSITHGWENIGKEYWDKYYEPRNAVNMGFGGDRTEHVLWRLEHSDFTNISPRLAVLMIGTNNSNGDDNTAEEIADGIIKICKVLRTELPSTKILLLAIFPRDSIPTAQRQKNSTASKLASSIADNRTIYYLDINSHFLTKDSILTRDIMYDYLHPTEKGYLIWAEAMEPEIIELMKK